MKGGSAVEGFEVIFYGKADGTFPARDFILSLEPKMRDIDIRRKHRFPDHIPPRARIHPLNQSSSIVCRENPESVFEGRCYRCSVVGFLHTG